MSSSHYYYSSSHNSHNIFIFIFFLEKLSAENTTPQANTLKTLALPCQ